MRQRVFLWTGGNPESVRTLLPLGDTPLFFRGKERNIAMAKTSKTTKWGSRRDTGAASIDEVLLVNGGRKVQRGAVQKCSARCVVPFIGWRPPPA
jgi:hypothetical protein